MDRMVGSVTALHCYFIVPWSSLDDVTSLEAKLLFWFVMHIKERLCICICKYLCLFMLDFCNDWQLHRVHECHGLWQYAFLLPINVRNFLPKLQW